MIDISTVKEAREFTQDLFDAIYDNILLTNVQEWFEGDEIGYVDVGDFLNLVQAIEEGETDILKIFVTYVWQGHSFEDVFGFDGNIMDIKVKMIQTLNSDFYSTMVLEPLIPELYVKEFRAVYDLVCKMILSWRGF